MIISKASCHRTSYHSVGGDEVPLVYLVIVNLDNLLKGDFERVISSIACIFGAVLQKVAR